MRQPETPWWAENGWRETVSWWTDPRLAYAAGLADGVALERARDSEAADQVHRAAVRRIERIVEAVDRRAAHDRGEAAA